MQGNENFEKHACQNTVAMETSNCLHQEMSSTKFGGVCCHFKIAITVQSQRGHFLPSLPPFQAEQG